jgi:hypothetical protein
MPPGGTLLPPRIFVSRAFRRWQNRVGMADRALAIAVAEMRAGLVDADLGGGVVKKRLSASGIGKRGGARVLVATRRGDRWFFLFGFLKNQKSNLDAAELTALRNWATELLALNDQALAAASQAGVLHEIDHQPTTPH